MLDSAEHRDHRTGKRFSTSMERSMSHHGSTEERVTGMSSENVRKQVSEAQPWTHETVNEPIRGFIATPFRQLEELTRLVQGTVSMQHPDHYPGTDSDTTSGKVIH